MVSVVLYSCMADHDGNDITKRAGPEMSLLATLLLYSRHMIALHRKLHCLSHTLSSLFRVWRRLSPCKLPPLWLRTF